MRLADWLGAAAAVVLAAGCFAGTRWIVQSTAGTGQDDLEYVRAYFRFGVVTVATFVGALALAPLVQRWSRWWPAVAAPIAGCVFQALFVIWAGRRQFGAFDFDNLLEQGWRQAHGQRPYVDYLTSTPPGFNLGIKWAYEIFGVNWDANLYFTAAFTCATFLWLYWLLRRLRLGGMAAFGMAFSIEAAAMLTLSFWWYNNSTTVMAAVLFLSVLVYLEAERDRWAELSYVVSLALVSLMKPNIAGVVLIVSVAAVLLAGRDRLRAVTLTTVAAVCSFALLALNRVSIPAMLAAYRAVAQERGLGTAGYDQMNSFEWLTTVCWLPILSLPLAWVWPRLWRALREREWRTAVVTAFYLLGFVVAWYGVVTNGEFREVECTVLLAACGAIAFGTRWTGPVMRRVYVAIVCASIGGSLYLGATRMRIYAVGPGQFFVWHDDRGEIETGLLRHMRVSQPMLEVMREVQASVAQDRGPFFFGPRMEWNYGQCGLASQAGLPAWWHPGTAFARADEPRLLEVWRSKKFGTLIFLKGDYTFYSNDFKRLIDAGYVRDDSAAAITIYRRRQ